MFIGILLAILFYGRPFSFLTDQISFLGDTSDPKSAFWFSLGFILAGILIMPHATYLYRILLPDFKLFGTISAIFFAIAGIGVFMLGIFAENVIYPIHVLSAMLAIGGIVLSCFFSLGPMIKKKIRKASWPSILQLLGMYIEFILLACFAIPVLAIPTLNQVLAGTFDPSQPPRFWALTEWLILAGSIIWACGMIYLSPDPSTQKTF
jgi:hypothetical protein